MINNAPTRSQLVSEAGLATPDYVNWFAAVAAALKTWVLSLTDQGAALAAQDMAVPQAISGGLYAFEFGLRITRAATTNSSATVVLRWTDNGIAQAVTFAAINGNTTFTTGSGRWFFRSDRNSSITVEVAYTSTGGVSMQYQLDAQLSVEG